MIKIEVCPGNLTPGFDRYSPACLRKLFDGKKVSPVLDFDYDADSIDLIDQINQISVSGVQEKLSAIINNDKITLTPTGQQGKYIIKPSPNYKHLRFRDQIPANEHLTMQIVKQEDFSSLAQKTAQTHGKDFKYTGSYEDVAALLKTNVSAWQVETSKLFTLVVFNYIFANGDAHLKNFSLQQSANGDYLLSPAYDLMNTSIHVQDEDFALHGGLIPQNEYSDIYSQTGHPCKEDFIIFGNRIGVLPKKLNAIIETFSKESPLIEALITRSFLDERTKRMYRRSYQERLSRFLREE